MTTGCRTYLVYRVDKGLGVIPTTKAADNVTHVPAREDRINQEGELTWTERPSDQKSKC